MIRKAVIVRNPTGLHLRPAGRLCDEAIRFDSKVGFRKGGVSTDAKSLLGVLGACVKCGDEIEIFCDGEDEEEAIEAIAALIENDLE